MDKQIHLRISKNTYELLEKKRIEEGLEDKQDLIRIFIKKGLNKNKSFFDKLRGLFSNE